MKDPSQKEPQKNQQVIRRKVLIVEKFINVMIVIRMYLVEIPLWLWAIFLVLLYALKLKRQGNLPSSIFVILAMICSVFGEYLKIDIVYLMAPLLAGVSHFLSFKIYWFPRPTLLVGMREDTLQNDTYLMEFYPIKKNQNAKKRIIPWNYRLQMKRMFEYEEHKGPIYIALMKFFITQLNKVKIMFAEGDEEPYDQAFIFSHGRGGTPLMYSQMLTRVTNLGSQKFGVFAVQHTEKDRTGEVELQKIKRYREIEVQVRAVQMAASVAHCNKKRMVMMGHSYGGATTIQTYHCLPEEEKKKISHLVLLDPWLFPLTESKLKQQIHCPVLILANEYFLQNEDVFYRNRQFVDSQKQGKVIYLTWAKGDHLHQIDLCFLIGNIFNRVKHSELSQEMLDKNIKAIQMFVGERNVTEEKMREVFKEDLLPDDFKPAKWNNYLTL